MRIGRSRLGHELEALGVRSGAVALVHCRMSALGTVVGGAETVVRALLDTVGLDGTLVAYLGWEDAPPDSLDALDAGERELVLAEQPVYDPTTGRARRDHGRLAEALRTWPGAVHSGHPEAGVAAVGPDASAIALPHPLDDAYGVGTPYARVVERGGQVVLLGAPLDTVTLVHHAESIAAVGGKRRVAWRCPVLGERRWRRSTTSTPVAVRFPTSKWRATSTTSSTSPECTRARGGSDGAARAGAAHIFDARLLVEVSVSLIEAAFGPDAA